MIRGCGAIIIFGMAPKTGIRCIGVVAVMAFRTIVGDQRMSAIERIIIIVYGEGCRHPVRGGGMALRTIRRDIQCLVIRIDRIVIICNMATCTLIRCIVVIPIVAGDAVIGNDHVFTGQRVIIIMNIERSRSPSGFCCMALSTVRWEP